MPIVKATREGLIGGRTASGAIVDLMLPFVALPCVGALHLWIHLINIASGASCRAIVLDVGPWNTQDAPYVFGPERPQAETGVDKTKRPTNGAGIDLGEYVWRALGLTDNALVTWEFCAPARVERGRQLTADQVLARLSMFNPPDPSRRRSRRTAAVGRIGP